MTKSGHSLRLSASAGLMCFLAALTGGCPFAPGQTLILDADDSGGDVNVRVGARVLLVLSGNASTGYEWEITELDTSVLEHTRTSYRSACTIPMPGCGEIETWRFTALSPGSTILRMIYHRPWEEVEPARTFELTVTVTGSD
ncbi:MAG: protease inhibitor I42 family protein [Phycisphaerales bacterium]|nr:MAG: protease inhibitor I42 family protein [Phycisphaerales bacterium]